MHGMQALEHGKQACPETSHVDQLLWRRRVAVVVEQITAVSKLQQQVEGAVLHKGSIVSNNVLVLRLLQGCKRSGFVDVKRTISTLGVCLENICAIFGRVVVIVHL